MKKLFYSAVAAVAAIFVTSTSAVAQDSFELNVGADIVSRYVWRGKDQDSGASLQPSMAFGYKGLSLGAWGSTSFSELDPKEFDISLGYEIGGFSALFTDYFWAGESAAYGHYKRDHFFELALAYCFGDNFPLTVSWATMLFGGESAELNADGDRMFSTYINLAYDFDIQGVSFTPSIGINPWESQFDDEFTVLDITLTGAKEIKITDSFSLPLFVQAIISPAFDKTYLVVGLSF